MIALRIAAWLALLGCPLRLAAQPAPDTLVVEVEGAVAQPGTVEVKAGGRLSDVLNAVRPDPDAYLLGASLQRVKERRDQVRLHAGLQYTVDQLPAHDDLHVRAIGAQLDDWLQSHPATGRTRLVLERRLMQAHPRLDPPAQAGDRVLVPLRPHTVRVMGAVEHPCEVPHEPLLDAPGYLARCPASAAADPDLLFVIQPDGLVQSLGVAAWNRADPQPVAAGGTVYVPIRQSAMNHLDATFNEAFASFIATQPVEP